MQELMSLDELTQDSVSVGTRKYIEEEGVKYFVGNIHRRAFVNSIDGISGNVDLNISYKNYPKIIKSKGLNGFKPNQNTEKNYFDYIVQKMILCGAWLRNI